MDDADPDVVLLDLMMPPGPDGLETLTRMRDRGRSAPVIMMSGKAQLTDAVRAVKLGAFQFLEKPLSPEGVLVTVRAALELNRTRAENRALQAELGRRAALIGSGPAMQQVATLIARVGPTEARVLITGESGTGKELVAAAIHAASRRRGRAFVTVNCAAIPRDLVESEMFGHERGSFTGATERRLGRFELAHGGTLFLDEVGDLSQEAQAKLLRTLETGELQRIGAETMMRIDARVVAATNRRLEEAVSSGAFREDLFFRLNVFPIHLPPLRERLEDLPALVAHLAERVRPRHAAHFTDAALDALASYSWPGNVRELANLVERLSILSGPVVDAPAVRQVIRGTPPGPATTPLASLLGRPLSDALDEFERGLISAALAQAQRNMAEAARILQTDRANLYRRMRRLGLDKSADAEQ
jgi:two-component system nitrogen regulation response regulator NtrX